MIRPAALCPLQLELLCAWQHCSQFTSVRTGPPFKPTVGISNADIHAIALVAACLFFIDRIIMISIRLFVTPPQYCVGGSGRGR